MGSLDLRLSRALILSNISTGTGSVLIRSRPEGICPEGICISIRYRSQFAFFKLKLVGCGMEMIVCSVCKLMMIGRWFEPRFVFVCQLVEVIREADANEISGEDAEGAYW